MIVSIIVKLLNAPTLEPGGGVLFSSKMLNLPDLEARGGGPGPRAPTRSANVYM